MFCKYSALPCVSFHRRAAASGSTDPPNAAESSVEVSFAGKGARSSRSNRPTFQISCNAAGNGAPSRTVSITFAAPRATIWCTTNVDNSSSRCASSTPMTTPTPEGAAVSDSTTPRNNATLSVTPDGAHAANAPSGMDLRRRRADRPPGFTALRRGNRQRLAGDATLPDTRRSADEDSADIGGRDCGVDGPHLGFAAGQRP